jgi:hypothetical protein
MAIVSIHCQRRTLNSWKEQHGEDKIQIFVYHCDIRLGVEHVFLAAGAKGSRGGVYIYIKCYW